MKTLPDPISFLKLMSDPVFKEFLTNKYYKKESLPFNIGDIGDLNFVSDNLEFFIIMRNYILKVSTDAALFKNFQELIKDQKEYPAQIDKIRLLSLNSKTLRDMMVKIEKAVKPDQIELYCDE
ncbi:hypothetical protein DID80_05870 [Candidatus Marinamargulisbacteria bacterium SCGC AAA071-K20]|nr:hypothetical protein DID80_05870 [Candidatus Marinamargulisbacteria bacterium SCGC AAA071-K20]